MSKAVINNSINTNEISVELSNNISTKSIDNSIYKAGKAYYQYLKNMKCESREDSSDCCTAFIMF